MRHERFSLNCPDIDDFKETQAVCNAWVATAIVGGAVIGAGATMFAASEAGDAQRDAAQMGIDAQQKNYAQTRADLTSYRVAGEDALKTLNSRLPELTSDIDVTKELQDPNSTAFKAYDFTKTQGLKAVQNSAAARGLGVSGAALKGASMFATGLADNTYKGLFDMENTNRTNAYNRLKSLVDSGQNAAAQTATVGTNTANQVGNLSVGAGNASAAQYNAMGGAAAGAVNNISGYMAYKGLYGGGGNANPGWYPSNAWYNN